MALSSQRRCRARHPSAWAASCPPCLFSRSRRHRRPANSRLLSSSETFTFGIVIRDCWWPAPFILCPQQESVCHSIVCCVCCSVRSAACFLLQACQSVSCSIAVWCALACARRGEQRAVRGGHHTASTEPSLQPKALGVVDGGQQPFPQLGLRPEARRAEKSATAHALSASPPPAAFITPRAVTRSLLSPHAPGSRTRAATAR